MTQQRRREGRAQTAERPAPQSATEQATEQPRSAALARIETIPQAELQRYEAAGFNAFRLAMTWQQCARDLNLGEFLYFMERCVSTGLDPLRKQAYAIKRRDTRSPSGYTVAHQIGIDGFRAIAASSGAYAGSDPPVFDEPIRVGGKAAHELCRVTVYRIVQGVRVPFTGECRFSEFYPGDGPNGAMWRQYPHNQLAKCTEAQALRKGFPVELGEFEIHGEIGSRDADSAFVDALADRGTAVAANVRELDSGGPERNAAEYQRLYAAAYGEDDDVPLEAPTETASVVAEPVEKPEPTTEPKPSPADEMEQLADQVQAKDAAQDDDTPPWEQPAARAPKMPQAEAVRPPNPKIGDRAARGLCTHGECIEHDTPNKAAVGTDPPRCLLHVG